jgi:hypothetical protein
MKWELGKVLSLLVRENEKELVFSRNIKGLTQLE